MWRQCSSHISFWWEVNKASCWNSTLSEFYFKNPISSGCEFTWLALAFYSTDQTLTYTGEARRIKMYAGKNSIAWLVNHPWWHHFTYGGIHQLLVMPFTQSSSNRGETDFLGLWTGACMARTGSAERRELAQEAWKRVRGKRWEKQDVHFWSYWIWEENELL